MAGQRNLATKDCSRRDKNKHNIKCHLPTTAACATKQTNKKIMFRGHNSWNDIKKNIFLTTNFRNIKLLFNTLFMQGDNVTPPPPLPKKKQLE